MNLGTGNLQGSLSSGINPLSLDDNEESGTGKIVHAKPDKNLKQLPGHSKDPKRGPFRMLLAKSDILPDLIISPNDDFKGVVFYDSETLEPRSNIFFLNNF